MIDTEFNAIEATVVVTVHGNLLSTNIRPAREKILNYLESEGIRESAWRTLRLDLSEAQMVDSTGLNFLVSLARFVRKREAKLHLLVGSNPVRKSLSFVRLDKTAQITLVTRN
jgi:anti-anti-sigma factor